MFRIEDQRDLGACLASQADWRADYPSALRTACGRSLSSGFSSQDRDDRGHDASADRASVLEFICALCGEKSGAMALDVQTLALSPDKCGSALSVLFQGQRSV